MASSTTTRSNVIPSMLYHDAPSAIDWLCRAFGFEKHLVVPGENNTVVHAQLRLGNGMIMTGSAETNRMPHLAKTPREVGGVGTQSVCLIVEDADAVHARAAAAGAEIVMPPSDMPYGGRAFACRDPEGHVWHVGTFDPWAEG
jgi:uncharacterized glyoxalase superfamily protein PhnB